MLAVVAYGLIDPKSYYLKKNIVSNIVEAKYQATLPLNQVNFIVFFIFINLIYLYEYMYQKSI